MPDVIASAGDRSLPLRERKKLRTRRALADAALRLFTENGLGSTTLEDLAPDDLRLQVLAELATTAFSVSGRHWVRHGGRGGRKALLDRLDGAVRAIPASLNLSARP